MYSRSSFGSYYPIDSIIHRLNPVVKIVNFVLMLIVLIVSKSLYTSLFLLGLIFVMSLLSYVPFRYYFNTFWFLRYIYILIAFICAYFDQSLQTCMIYIIKLVVLVEYINIIAYTTSPSESAYGIEKFLSNFNFLFLKLSKISFRINNILRYYPNLLTVRGKAYKAAASRGIDYYNTDIINRSLIFMKLQFSVKRLHDYKNKMTHINNNLKLFSLKTYRTNYRTNKVSFNDIFFLIFHLLLIYTCIIEAGI